MRTKNSLLNFLTSIVPFVVFVALGFLKIRVWQSSLDENIYALNQLFFQLFAYLSIAEAGIGALVQKEYYKLLIDEDHDMICKYYTVSKKMLRTVCYVIMAAGLILSFFLKYLAKDNALTQMYMQEVFLLFLAKSLVEYFMFSPRFVLTADQRLYKINFQMYFYRILETLMEIGLIYVGMSYVLVLCCSIVLRIVMNLHLNKIVFREYPWLHTVSDTQGLKIEGMKHVFIYKIVSAIQENVGALLISAFVNPISVIIYSNYKYITKYVNDFMYQMGVALTSSLGNLLYGENNEEGYNTYEMINTMFYFMASFLTIAVGYCINSFIIIWVGENKVLDSISLYCLLFVFFHNIARRPQYILKDVFALYKELQLISIAEAIVTLLLSYILVIHWGIKGILIAAVLAIIATNFWYFPIAVYKKIFNKFPILDFCKYFFCIGLISSMLWISNNYLPSISKQSFMMWFVCSCIYSIGILVVLSVVYFLIFKSFRVLCRKGINVLKELIINKRKTYEKL